MEKKNTKILYDGKCGRTCIACRKKSDKGSMLRISKFGDVISVDKSQTAMGRGCYICSDKKCMGLLVTKRLLNRAFKCNVDTLVYSDIQTKLETI